MKKKMFVYVVDKILTQGIQKISGYLFDMDRIFENNEKTYTKGNWYFTEEEAKHDAIHIRENHIKKFQEEIELIKKIKIKNDNQKKENKIKKGGELK